MSQEEWTQEQLEDFRKRWNALVHTHDAVVSLVIPERVYQLTLTEGLIETAEVDIVHEGKRYKGIIPCVGEA